MRRIDEVEKIVAMIEPGNTRVHMHPECDQIVAAIVDWNDAPESEKPTWKQFCQELVDRFAQDESLGANPETTLRHFRDDYVAPQLATSALWMQKGAARAGMDLNLLRQHQETLKQHDKTLAVIDKALEVAQARVEASNGEEGTTNLVNLLERRQAVVQQREATLEAILKLQMILGNVEDKRVSKSMSVKVDAQSDSEQAKAIMEQARRRQRPPAIETTAKVQSPDD